MLFYLVTFLLVHLNLQPFIKRNLNTMETMSLIISVFTIYLGLFFISARYEDGGNLIFYFHLLIVVLSEVNTLMCCIVVIIQNAVFVIFLLYHYISEFRKSLRYNHQKIFIFLCFFCRKQKFEKIQSKLLEKDLFIDKIEEIITS